MRELATSCLRPVAAAVCLFLPLQGLAQAPAFVDSAQRRVELPTGPVAKVLAAGPPAAVIVYSLAPRKFMGWVRPLDGEALAYLPARFRDLPVQGRITGRNPADAAAVKALGPDVIVDFGTVSAAYVDIATRTQAATGIPYVLIDGTLRATPQALRASASISRAVPTATTPTAPAPSPTRSSRPRAA